MKLSIITINLNNFSVLKKTIESVINQSFTDFEYIIIDGGSTDGSQDVIRKYEDKIVYWVSEPDKGIYNAMNKGIRQAKGEYLLFLNSGDWLVSEDILEIFFSKINSSDIVYGDIILYNNDGSKNLLKTKAAEEITMAYFFSNTICHQGALIKRELFKEILYDETLKIVADWKFFIQQIVFKNCSLQYIELPLSNWNIHGISNDRESWPLYKREKELVLKEILPNRIKCDYDLFLQIVRSPLLQYIPLLNNTTGFQKLVSRMVGLLVGLYQFVRTSKSIK